jgi:membrane-bound inhibitor of C-type lysozyme
MIRLPRCVLSAGIVALGITGCASPRHLENRVVFRCPGGEAIEATFRDGEVAVTVPDGTKVVLPQVISASGGRYSDGMTTLWNKGNTVFIMKGEEITVKDCVAEGEK